MRNSAFASLLAVAAVVGACSAVDDFTKFTFTDAGAVDTDMGAGGLPGFGQPCTGTCAIGPEPTHPLTCFSAFGSVTVPGGICTHTCTLPGAAGCTGLGSGEADCVLIENTQVCLPQCNPNGGKSCRNSIGWGCCANRNVVTNTGDCAPTMSNLCR